MATSSIAELPKTDAYRAALTAEEKKKTKKDQEITKGMASNMLPPSLNERDQRKLNSKLLSKLKVIDAQEKQYLKLKNKDTEFAKNLKKRMDTNLTDVAGIREQGGFISDEVLAKREELFKRKERGDPRFDLLDFVRGRKSLGPLEGTEERDKRLASEAQDDRTTFPVVPKDSEAAIALKDAQQFMDPIILGKTKTDTDATTKEVDTNIAAGPKTVKVPEAVKVPEVKPEETISSGLDPDRDINEQIQTQLPPGAAIDQNTSSIDTGGQSPLEVYTDLIKGIKAKPTVIEQASLNQGKPSPFAEYRDFLDKQGLDRKKQNRFLDQMPLFNAALTALASNDPNVIRTIAAAGKSYLDTAMNIGERKRQLNNENAKTRFLLGQAESEFQRGERDFAFRLKKEANAAALANRQVEFQIAGQTATLLASLEQTKATKELKQTQMENTAEARRQTSEIQKQGNQIRKDALDERIRGRQVGEALARSVARLKAVDDRDVAINAELGSQAGILRVQQKIVELTETEKSKRGYIANFLKGVDDNKITVEAIEAVKKEIEGEYNLKRSKL
jgi:hypothetical protein